MGKNLNIEYSQKLLDHSRQSVKDAFKTTSKREIQKTAEGTVDLIGNKIVQKTSKVFTAELFRVFFRNGRRRIRKTNRKVFISRKKTVNS